MLETGFPFLGGVKHSTSLAAPFNFSRAMPDQLIIFEDEHLLVINKPAGLNTHSPSPFAGEGIYEWLKNREVRWANLAIIHRLDKETSGVMVLGKTPLANRSLTAQFTQHTIRKKYLLRTEQEISWQQFSARSCLIRSGEKYLNRPCHADGEKAETQFRKVTRDEGFFSKGAWIEAEPITGKTHQIRVQAAAHGFPILGDTLYGGASAARVFLHAFTLCLRHPATGEEMQFTAPVDWAEASRQALRQRLIVSEETNTFRLIHGAADGWPGWQVDRLGEYLLSQAEKPLDENMKSALREWGERDALRGAYHKILRRHVRGIPPQTVSPALVWGAAAPEEILIQENAVQFSIRFHEGYSVGLFLDQRDNRRRLLMRRAAAQFPLWETGAGEKCEVLNAFAYTCGFSVCAARAGARVTSLDLSKKYLEWGRRNFRLNGLNPDEHDFIFGDVFAWLRRLEKKSRRFDVVLLDPPTFSQSKEHGVFRAEKDYGALMKAALAVLKPNGVLFASTNAAELPPEDFLETLSAAVASGHRKIVKSSFAPQPPDFPIAREEPAYLKTVWLRVA